MVTQSISIWYLWEHHTQIAAFNLQDWLMIAGGAIAAAASTLATTGKPDPQAMVIAALGGAFLTLEGILKQAPKDRTPAKPMMTEADGKVTFNP